MPRRLTGVGRRQPRTLSDFEIADQLCFIAAWSPPAERWEEIKSWMSISREEFIAADQFRWRSWDQYLDDYLAVRDEFIAKDGLSKVCEFAAEKELPRRGNR